MIQISKTDSYLVSYNMMLPYSIQLSGQQIYNQYIHKMEESNLFLLLLGWVVYCLNEQVIHIQQSVELI